jgi:DNA-binding response OmpR family regulator
VTAAKKILVVEDDAAMNHLLRDFLLRQGYSVETSTSFAGAMSWLNSPTGAKTDLVLSDVKLGGATGIDLARALTAQKPALPVILFSVFEQHEQEALKNGARRFLRKPFSLSLLAEVLLEQLGPT